MLRRNRTAAVRYYAAGQPAAGGEFCRAEFFLIMDFSLLSPLEFFADPKNGDGRNNKPPAMRVRVDCYTKKLPFRLQ